MLRSRVLDDAAQFDGILLDSLIPPATTEVWDLSRHSNVVDAVGRQALPDCDNDDACRQRLGGSAVTALRALEQDALIASQFPGGRPKMFFGALLDSQNARALILEIIAGAMADEWSPMNEAKARLQSLTAPFATVIAVTGTPIIPSGKPN